MTKHSVPIRHLGERGEKALEEAKDYMSGTHAKNAVCCFGRTVSWDQYDQLMELSQTMQGHAYISRLSTAYMYGLQALIAMRDNMSREPSDARWRALFTARTWRLLEGVQGLDAQERRKRYDSIAQILIEQGIECHGSDFLIALFPYLYNQRQERRE